MRNPFDVVFGITARLLARTGLIDRERGERIADLSWPPVLGKAARQSRITADVAMVGSALGPAAIAGLGFATVYWRIANGIVFGLAGGTINQISQRFGAGDHDRVDLALKQSVWVSLLIALPFTVVYLQFPYKLIALFGTDETTVAYGATYLQVISVGTVLRALAAIASRALAGADETWIPMTIRGGAAVVNILLNGVFIFGLGLGIYGAALGTLIAEVLATGVFVWGFLWGRVPLIGDFPIGLRPGGPYFDLALSYQLIDISFPLIVRGLVKRSAMFPFYVILATFGTGIVSAYEISRRIRGQMKSPGSGFALAASSLVGQSLGRGNEREAEEYGWDVFWFSLVIYLATSILVFVFAPSITSIFVQDRMAVSRTAPFVRVIAIGLIAHGATRSLVGVLKAAGDTRWPMYAEFVGLYLFMLPIVYVGSVSSIGVIGVYVAAIMETTIPALANLYRVWTGKWKTISRTYRGSFTES